VNPSENSNPTPPALPDVGVGVGVDTPAPALTGRRRLLRAGLMGAPALLALKSSPVLAVNCKLPSGFSASGNFSKTGKNSCATPAPVPSAWSTRISSGKYTGTTITPATLFTSVGFNFRTGYFTNTETFSSVLARGNGNIAALTASAYLASISNGGATFANSNTIRAMWNNGVLGGSYAAGSGVVWGETQVKKYLLYATGQA